MQDQEVGRILERAAHARHADLEAWENSLRAAVLSAGAKALASLLDGVGCGRQDESDSLQLWCPDGEPRLEVEAAFDDSRPGGLQTFFVSMSCL